MKCPVCGNMHLIMSDRYGIEIDYCPQCRGVWLARDELAKLIARSESAPTAEVPAPLKSPPRHGGQRSPAQYGTLHGYDKEGYGQKRKKDLIGELFDF